MKKQQVLLDSLQWWGGPQKMVRHFHWKLQKIDLEGTITNEWGLILFQFVLPATHSCTLHNIPHSECATVQLQQLWKVQTGLVLKGEGDD